MKWQFCVEILPWAPATEEVEAEYLLMSESMVAAIEAATEQFQEESGKDISNYLRRARSC